MTCLGAKEERGHGRENRTRCMVVHGVRNAHAYVSNLSSTNGNKSRFCVRRQPSPRSNPFLPTNLLPATTQGLERRVFLGQPQGAGFQPYVF